MSEFDLLKAQRRIFESGLGPNEKIVALAIVDFYSRKSPRPFPGLDLLVQRTSLSRSTVIRSLAELETAGALLIAKRVGLPNQYDLRPLMSLPVSQGHQCQPDTSATVTPVPEGHPTSVNVTPPPVSPRHPKEPIKEPNEGTQVSPPPADGPSPPRSSSPKPRPKKKTDLNDDQRKAYSAFVAGYHELFLELRSAKPKFDDKEGKFTKKLLEAVKWDATEALRRTRNCMTGFGGEQRALMQAANDPDRWVVEPKVNGKTVAVQRGADDAVVANYGRSGAEVLAQRALRLEAQEREAGARR